MKALRRTKDAGFSVVELIIVIALLSVLASVTFSMTGILAGRRANAMSEKIVQMLSKTKTDTLAFSAGGFARAKEADVSLTLRRESDGYYLLQTVKEQEEDAFLSAERVRVTAVYASGRNEAVTDAVSVQVTEDVQVRIAFDKKTGALLPEEDGHYLKRLLLEEDDRVYEIRLVPATGNCYVETAASQSNTAASEDE